jgi:hypothetical protein
VGVKEEPSNQFNALFVVELVRLLRSSRQLNPLIVLWRGAFVSFIPPLPYGWSETNFPPTNQAPTPSSSRCTAASPPARPPSTRPTRLRALASLCTELLKALAPTPQTQT